MIVWVCYKRQLLCSTWTKKACPHCANITNLLETMTSSSLSIMRRCHALKFHRRAGMSGYSERNNKWLLQVLRWFKPTSIPISFLLYFTCRFSFMYVCTWRVTLSNSMVGQLCQDLTRETIKQTSSRIIEIFYSLFFISLCFMYNMSIYNKVSCFAMSTGENYRKLSSMIYIIMYNETEWVGEERYIGI